MARYRKPYVLIKQKKKSGFIWYYLLPGDGKRGKIFLENL